MEAHFCCLCLLSLYLQRSMSWTVDYLSCVIGECAEQCDISASTVDLPQAEALHVLCAVVGSASLTAAVMMHLGRILWFCFEGLASPFWVVRNAAQQLYGIFLCNSFSNLWLDAIKTEVLKGDKN